MSPQPSKLCDVPLLSRKKTNAHKNSQKDKYLYTFEKSKREKRTHGGFYQILRIKFVVKQSCHNVIFPCLGWQHLQPFTWSLMIWGCQYIDLSFIHSASLLSLLDLHENLWPCVDETLDLTSLVLWIKIYNNVVLVSPWFFRIFRCHPALVLDFI